jgi:Na+-translocating ferredoxin:NAD+ oxidoreductase RnfG subunit
MNHVIKTTKRSLAVIVLACAAMLLPGRADAIKYMGLKDAIKHFLPKGAKVSKVTKTLSASQLAAVKKRFNLKDKTDYKDVITAGPHEIYIGRGAGDKAEVYIFIMEQYWRTCYHKFAVGISPDGKIIEVAPMELPCPYQRPIAKKSFLNQFKGKQIKKGGAVPAHLNKDIDVVTGATASSEATALVARRALALFEVFFAS